MKLGIGEVRARRDRASTRSSLGLMREPAFGEEARSPVARTLIVEDDAENVGAGQTRKSELLARLQATLEQTIEAGLAGTPYEARGCPLLIKAISRYRRKSAAELEASLLRYAPEAQGAESANAYLALVDARVKSSVQHFAETGELRGLPDELTGFATVPSLEDAAGSLLEGALGFAGRLFGGLTGAFMKSVEEAGSARADPEAVRDELGAGEALDPRVRLPMERALGHDFSRVRVHRDHGAARLSEELGARAFTVGQDIAFAAGEYAPGTPVGDALIAHELTHTAQQTSGGTSSSSQSERTFEEEADRGAASAVMALWAPGHELEPPRSVLSKSGLRLRRCAGTKKEAEEATGGETKGAVTCPKGAKPPTRVPRGEPNKFDARAKALIDIALDKEKSPEAASREFVSGILCAYYPDKVHLVKKLEYDANVPGMKASSNGTVSFSEYMVESIRDSKRNFARQVLRVGHELQHLEQYEAGMTGHDKQDEREFLAFADNGLALEFEGIGRMRGNTRVQVIDTALGYYHCLKPEKQKQYEEKKEQLLARRKEYVDTEPPSSCARQDDSKQEEGD